MNPFIIMNIEFDFGLYNNCRDSRAFIGREAVINKSIDNENDVRCNTTLSNPHHVGEIVKICSCKRMANLHNMNTGEFPNFDTGVCTGCNFRRGEIRNKRKCKGKLFLKETSQLATSKMTGKTTSKKSRRRRSKRYHDKQRE